MLDKVVATFGALFVLTVFVIGFAISLGLMGLWYNLQNEAVYLAVSQAKYGGYTTKANTELNRFIQECKLDRSRLTVQVSAAWGPVPWGTPVRATLTYRYPFKLAKWFTFDVPVTGAGRAVSAYVPGIYNVSYTGPIY